MCTLTRLLNITVVWDKTTLSGQLRNGKLIVSREATGVTKLWSIRNKRGIDVSEIHASCFANDYLVVTGCATEVLLRNVGRLHIENTCGTH